VQPVFQIIRWANHSSVSSELVGALTDRASAGGLVVLALPDARQPVLVGTAVAAARVVVLALVAATAVLAGVALRLADEQRDHDEQEQKTESHNYLQSGIGTGKKVADTRSRQRC
jgi:hypothetical protein